MKADGTVWSWGNNWFGQLGDNTTTDRFVPGPVLGPDGVGQLNLLHGPESPAPTYTVTFDANGGTDAPAPQSKLQDEPLVLTAAEPARPGYVFKGWAATASATGAQYQSGAAYSANADATLYAVWQPEAYPFRFFTGSGATPAISYENYHDKPFYLNSLFLTHAAALERESCVLLGWSETPGANAPDYPPDGVVNLDRAADFYAVWGFNQNVEKYGDTSSVEVTPANAFAPGTVMHANAWAYDFTLTLPQQAMIMTYEIKFHNGGDNNVQPEGFVTVRLAVPDRYIELGGNPEELVVTYQSAVVPSRIETSGGKYFIVFETDHFSEYSIERVPKSTGGNDGGNQPGWRKLPNWLHWILRIFFFGWLWMK